jgi:hypothetical protein
MIGDQPYGSARGTTERAASGRQSLRIGYLNLPGLDKANDHFVVLKRPLPKAIPGKPTALTAQVYGDGGECDLNLWISDADNEVWQFTFGAIKHTGWQTMTLPLDPSAGGPVQVVVNRRNGKLDYPLQLQGLALENTRNEVISGAIFLDDLRISTVPAAPIVARATITATLTITPTRAGATLTATAATITATRTTTPTQAVATAQPPAPAAPAVLSGHIVYSVWDPGPKTYRLVMRNTSGTDAQEIYYGATQPDFCQAPANRIIANGYLAPKEGTLAIDLGGAVQEVIPNTGDALPACSPDGGRVVFQSAREGRMQIWVHRDIRERDDQASQKLGPYYDGSYPTWSSRSRIFWGGCDWWTGQGNNCGLWQVSEDGMGDPVRVSSGVGDTAPDVTPDGNRVAYMSRGTGRWQVFVASANGGGNTQLTTLGDNGLPTWSPDGRSIAFVSNRDGAWALWVMGATGGSQRKLVALEAGFGLGPIDWTEQRISWGQ